MNVSITELFPSDTSIDVSPEIFGGVTSVTVIFPLFNASLPTLVLFGPEITTLEKSIV